jgi:hypothetical protein
MNRLEGFELAQAVAETTTPDNSTKRSTKRLLATMLLWLQLSCVE